jgi:hypothetical protein
MLVKRKIRGVKNQLPDRSEVWSRLYMSTRYRRLDQTISRIRHDGLSYLSHRALSDICLRVMEIERTGLAGDFVEAGCGWGGSTLAIALCKESARRLAVYDVFGMIPPPTGADGKTANDRYHEIQSGESAGLKGRKYYGYEDNLLHKVTNLLTSSGYSPGQHNITLVKGLFGDTLRPAGPIAFAHIDCDWYESVRVCLERIVPHLTPGGTLIVDDYDAWPGCRRAVDEYFAGRSDIYEFAHRARLHITVKQV